MFEFAIVLFIGWLTFRVILPLIGAGIIGVANVVTGAVSTQPETVYVRTPAEAAALSERVLSKR